VAQRKPYPLRLSEPMLFALQRWADDELRSVNAQIEYLLRDALRRSGRWSKATAAEQEPPTEAGKEDE
jgi:hypothetical protein